MAGPSYQEKSLYGTLAVELFVYGAYFFEHHENSVDKVALMILGVIAAQIALRAVIAAVTRNRLTDERDVLIGLRGYRAGYVTVVSLMVFGLAMLWVHTRAGNFPIHNAWVGLHFLSVFFGILVISDIVKTVTQIVSYRRAL